MQEGESSGIIGESTVASSDDRKDWLDSGGNGLFCDRAPLRANQTKQAVSRWQALAEHLITRYNDGYVRNEKGKPEEVDYPETWLREVLKSRPEQFKQDNRGKAVETDLSY